jgi:hypothetical protein
MPPLLIMFGEKPLAGCIKKGDTSFTVGLLGSWLVCYRELVPHFVTFYTLTRIFNIMVRARPVYGAHAN